MDLNIAPSNAPILELTLDQSSYDSTPMQLAFDHHFLLNALRFGFRELHLQANNYPVFLYQSQPALHLDIDAR